jgi:hypothetical protein
LVSSSSIGGLVMPSATGWTVTMYLRFQLE